MGTWKPDSPRSLTNLPPCGEDLKALRGKENGLKRLTEAQRG